MVDLAVVRFLWQSSVSDVFSLASREKKSQVRETDVILKKVFESANSGSSSPLDWFVERTYA